MSTQHSDTIELGHLARTLANGWRAIVGFTLAGILLAAVIIAFAPRKFTGVSTIVLKSGGGPSSSGLSSIAGLSDITAGLLGGKSPMETEVEILSSRALLETVVDSLRLQAKVSGAVPVPAIDVITALDAPGSFKERRYHFEKKAGANRYHFEGKDGAGEMVPGTSLSLPVGTVTFAGGAALPPSFDLRLRDKQDAIKWLDGHLKVAKEKGEVASITYKGDDSISAARVPNTVLGAYLARRRGTDRGINQRRVEFLMAKNDSMERALSQAAQALRRQQESSGVLDAEASAKVELESGATLRLKLTDVQVEQGALKDLLDQIKANTVEARQLAAYPRFISSPIIVGLVSELTTLEGRRTTLLTQYPETDKTVVAVDKSIADVKAKLVPYAETYAATLARERADLEAAQEKINRNLARLPGALASAGILERDVLDLSKLSAVLQAQIVEAKLAAIGEGGDVRPLDLAFVPKKPSFPDPLITAGLGTFGGLMIGMFAAVMFGSVGRWMRDPVEVERTTGIPALQFDPAVPLLLNGSSRTIVVAPIESGTPITAVVTRLAQTAASRSLSAAVLDLSSVTSGVNGSIERLQTDHDLVIVQLSSLVSDTAAAVLQHNRPVLLVAPSRRVDRRKLMGAVQMLKRLDVPVAGIVMSNGASRERTLTP